MSEPDTTDDLDRDDCAHCHGTGQIAKEVAGRSGLVHCPHCDNFPESVFPDGIPDSPHDRLDEINAELEALDEDERRLKDAQTAITAATDAIDDALDTGVFDDDTEAVLSHLKGQLSHTTRHHLLNGPHINNARQELRDERHTLLWYLDELEAQTQGWGEAR